MNQGAEHAPAKNENPENGGRRRELPPDIRAIVTRALVAAIVAAIGDLNVAAMLAGFRLGLAVGARAAKGGAR